jgi:hypothetical protein
MDDRSLIIHGGASIPAVVGFVNASWPLAMIEADAAGIRVSIRWKPLASLLGRLRLTSGDAWVTSWGDLERALVTSRSVFLIPHSGRGCRFVTRRGSLDPFVDVLAAHAVPVKRVRSTYQRTFRL